MSDTTIAGYGIEPQEVSAVLDTLIGDREPDDDALTWYRHLSSRQALLTAAVDKIAAARAAAALELYEEIGTYRKVADLLGVGHARVQQLIETARAA